MKHALHCTYAALLVGAILGVISFMLELHMAWFMRGVIMGMFVMVGFTWVRHR